MDTFNNPNRRFRGQPKDPLSLHQTTSRGYPYVVPSLGWNFRLSPVPTLATRQGFSEGFKTPPPPKRSSGSARSSSVKGKRLRGPYNRKNGVKPVVVDTDVRYASFSSHRLAALLHALEMSLFALSIRPLLAGCPAVMRWCSIPRLCRYAWNGAALNSPPLSVIQISGTPWRGRNCSANASHTLLLVLSGKGYTSSQPVQWSMMVRA